MDSGQPNSYIPPNIDWKEKLQPINYKPGSRRGKKMARKRIPVRGPYKLK